VSRAQLRKLRVKVNELVCTYLCQTTLSVSPPVYCTTCILELHIYSLGNVSNAW
jgi:hypothetical protein